METVLIYPFSEETDFFLDTNSLEAGINIVALSCLKRAKYTGLEYRYKGKVLTVVDDFYSQLKKVDTVWFVDSSEKEGGGIENIILEKIKECIGLRKKIRYFREKATKAEKEMVSAYGIQVAGGKTGDENRFKYVKNSPLMDIETPIVAVIGLLEGTGKCNMLLHLKNVFLKNQLKVSGIGTRNYSELFGLHPFPGFMRGKMSEVDKIVAFNNYVKYIENQEEPNVIIIGVSGGTNTFSKEIYSDFGTTAYKVFQAIKPDSTILCAPCFLTDKQNVSQTIVDVEHRLSTYIDYVAMESKIICSNESERYKEVRFLSVDEIEVIERLNDYNDKRYYSAASQRHEIATAVFEQLKGYSDVQTI